jgi:hypothetical protein
MLEYPATLLLIAGGAQAVGPCFSLFLVPDSTLIHTKVPPLLLACYGQLEQACGGYLVYSVPAMQMLCTDYKVPRYVGR